MSEDCKAWLRENFPHFFEALQQDIKNLDEGKPINYERAIESLLLDMEEEETDVVTVGQIERIAKEMVGEADV